jgi:hypothetical protein
MFNKAHLYLSTEAFFAHKWTTTLADPYTKTHTDKKVITPFDSHYLGLESRNSFMILRISYLAVTELITEFICKF